MSANVLTQSSPLQELEDQATLDKIDELRSHMVEEGEALVASPELEEAEEVFECKAKMVIQPGSCKWFLVPSYEDWMHDDLGEIRTIPGTIYSADEPYTPGQMALSGYFQADETQQWLWVEDGKVELDWKMQAPWHADLLEFPAVAAELEACMEMPEYRYQIEHEIFAQGLRP